MLIIIFLIDHLVDREEHELHPPKPLYLSDTDSCAINTKMKFKNVGP